MNLIRNIALITITLTWAIVSPEEATGAEINHPADHRPRVLLIGDSLSVGPFGDIMHEWLVNRIGRPQVFSYAACGACPEHWLPATNPIQSRCGYRERTPLSDSYKDGKKTRATTPKIDRLLALHRPDVVIVQLGTNHFDTLEQEGRDAIPRLEAIYAELSRSLHLPGSPVRLVIWITPPDSVRFPEWVEQEVTRIIARNNEKSGDFTIFSQTRYIKGVSGHDGVHYEKRGAETWAAPILNTLGDVFTRYGIPPHLISYDNPNKNH